MDEHPGTGAVAPRPFDLYVWAKPGELEDSRAAELVATWQRSGGDPAASPFEPTTDIGWFYRELKESLPELDAVSDATPRVTRVPIWASGSDEAPARVVAIRLSRPIQHDELEDISSLGTKYDLVVFDAINGKVHRPLDEMSAYASATFWPRGAMQAATGGTAGLVMAVVAWFVGVPIVSGIGVIIGAFLFGMAVLTFAAEGRKRLARRRR